MSCVHYLNPGEQRVVATSTTQIFIPSTGWYLALGVDMVRVGMRLLAAPAYNTFSCHFG